MPASVLWFRRDLRLDDNPALAAAAASGHAVVPVFVLDGSADRWQAGGAARWWLHASLEALDAALRARGSRLLLRRGDPQQEIVRLIAETGAEQLFCNRDFTPAGRRLETALEADLNRHGTAVQRFNASLLHEPQALVTAAGGSFKVFSAFWKACRAGLQHRPAAPTPGRLPGPAQWPQSLTLADLDLRPTRPDWAAGLRASWQPGEAAAQRALDEFLATAIGSYATARDRPGVPATSRLSPHLAMGEIGPWQVWRAAAHAADQGTAGSDISLEKFRSELGWREFSHHLAFHAEDLARVNFRREFDHFPWRTDRAHLRAWQRGRTGYPIVDAGMRELLHSGWMHNRVRMVCASFLVKHLLIDWRAGEDWFRDTLVDADFASNAANWQWVAGCGADAAPYFRIFNPVLQGEKFDADGSYVRRWLPELAALPDRLIHKPWMADAASLDRAGIKLGGTYPWPIVDHASARQRALGAFAALRQKR